MQDNDQELLDRANGLKSKCYSCKKCVLGQTEKLDGFDPHVYATGNVLSKIFFIAEAPGYDETVKRVPLIGRSGKIYEEEILKRLGLERKDVWTTNTCLCRPPNNRKPTREEIELCNEHLKEQFDFIKPKLVVTLGIVPMSEMIGIKSGILKIAGQMYKSEKYNVDCYPLVHPSFYLRNGSNFTHLHECVDNLKKYIENYAK